MPFPDAASGWPGAELRRGRSARCAPGLVGTIQATEALKLILGVGDALIGRLLLVDALGMDFRTVRVRRDPKCPACGTREITRLIDYDEYCGTSPTTSTSTMTRVPEMTPRELADALERGDDLDLLDVREPYEWSLGVLPNSYWPSLRVSGGGLIRDSLLRGSGPVLALTHWRYMAGVVLATVCGLFRSAPQIGNFNRIVAGFDAIGLAAFAVLGTNKALRTELHWTASVFVGVVSAVGGGLLRERT